MRLEHPYQPLAQPGQWLRGNLHAHTNRSDGSRQPQQVLDDYARRGYHFLMISDHDVITTPDDYAQWNCHDMAMIPGYELTRLGPHLLHINTSTRVEPHDDRPRLIGQALEAGGLIAVNHPNWGKRFNHCPQECMDDWQGYFAMEIYNGVIGRLHGSPYATDRWDMLLDAGRRVWGLANDDSHRDGDMELGWNMVYAPQRTTEAVVRALEQGCFYASTGVTIESIEVDGSRIRITTGAAQRITALSDVGRRVAQVETNTIEVEMPENASYLRFECWGPGEKFAWTQPFFPVKE